MVILWDNVGVTCWVIWAHESKNMTGSRVRELSRTSVCLWVGRGLWAASELHLSTAAAVYRANNRSRTRSTSLENSTFSTADDRRSVGTRKCRKIASMISQGFFQGSESKRRFFVQSIVRARWLICDREIKLSVSLFSSGSTYSISKSTCTNNKTLTCTIVEVKHPSASSVFSSSFTRTWYWRLRQWKSFEDLSCLWSDFFHDFDEM